jgi:hypothetical protein
MCASPPHPFLALWVCGSPEPNDLSDALFPLPLLRQVGGGEAGTQPMDDETGTGAAAVANGANGGATPPSATSTPATVSNDGGGGVEAFCGGVAELRIMMQEEMATLKHPLPDLVEVPFDYFSSCNPSSKYDSDTLIDAKWLLFDKEEAQRKCTELRVKVDKVHASPFTRHALEKAAVAARRLKDLQKKERDLTTVTANVKRQQEESGLFLTSLGDGKIPGYDQPMEFGPFGWTPNHLLPKQLQQFSSHVTKRETLQAVRQIRESQARLEGQLEKQLTATHTTVVKRQASLAAFDKPLKEHRQVVEAYVDHAKTRREQLLRELDSVQEALDDLNGLPPQKRQKSLISEYEQEQKAMSTMPPPRFGEPYPDPPRKRVKDMDPRTERRQDELFTQRRKLILELISLGDISRLGEMNWGHGNLEGKAVRQARADLDAAVNNHPEVKRARALVPSKEQLQKASKAADEKAAKAELEAAEQRALSGEPPPELTQQEECKRVLAAFGPFDVLDVPRDAGDDHVEKRFRELSLRTHPDKGGSGDAFKRVEQARAKLMDAEKRQKYIKTYPLRRLRTGLTGPLFDSEHALDEARAKWLQFTLQTLLDPLFDQLPAKGADTTCTPKQTDLPGGKLTPEMQLARALDYLLDFGYNLQVAKDLCVREHRAGEKVRSLDDKKTRVATFTCTYELKDLKLRVEMPFEIVTLRQSCKLIMPALANAVIDSKFFKGLKEVLNNALHGRISDLRSYNQERVPLRIERGIEALKAEERRPGTRDNDAMRLLQEELNEAERAWFDAEFRKTEFGRSFAGWVRYAKKSAGDEDAAMENDSPEAMQDEPDDALRLMG